MTSVQAAAFEMSKPPGERSINALRFLVAPVPDAMTGGLRAL
jgi:hypothetical protein